MICTTCGYPSKSRLRKGECWTCYAYRHRHGVQRPEELIIAYGRRFTHLPRSLERSM